MWKLRHGLRSVSTALMRERLPVPSLPPHLHQHLKPLREWIWATTDSLPAPLYDIDYYIDHLLNQTGEDWCAIGHDGYGINEWYLHCYVVHGPLTVLVQAPWGGSLMNHQAAREGVRKRFELLDRLLSAMQQAMQKGVSLPGRLIVQQTSIVDPRWGWIGRDGEVHWVEEFANAMTPALESLLALQ